jgi:hypothetical protein
VKVSVTVEVGSTSISLQADDISSIASDLSESVASGEASVVWATSNDTKTSCTSAAAFAARATRLGSPATTSVTVVYTLVVDVSVLVVSPVLVRVLKCTSELTHLKD